MNTYNFCIFFLSPSKEDGGRKKIIQECRSGNQARHVMTHTGDRNTYSLDHRSQHFACGWERRNDVSKEDQFTERTLRNLEKKWFNIFIIYYNVKIK